MFTERNIKSIVSNSVKSVLTSENEPITELQITEIITKSVSACLLSDDFIHYIDEELGKLID